MNSVAPTTSKGSAGFTLAEVVLALGIVSFCLLAIVGLLPVGMNSIRSARNEIAAASVTQWISNAIRNASVTGTTSSFEYTALSPYSSLSWSTGGSSVAKDYSNLSYGGTPSNNILDQQFNVHIELSPPSSLAASGTALVSVAWPTRAQWDADNRRWINAQGSISTWIVFLPRP